VLLGQYRKADIDEPEIFLQSWARIFSAYPDDVVKTVVDPLGGIASRISWPATVKELGGACKAEAARRAERERAAENIRAQFEERDRNERERAGPRQAYDAIAAEMRDRGLAVGQLPARSRLVGPGEVDWGAGWSPQPPLIGRDDGKHMRRIADDLAARKARNDARRSEPNEGEETG
jgi:hypothetical protein